MKAIADTGFLLAFLRRNDRHHDWAVALSKRVAEPLLTCEAVLAETAFHVRNSGVVLELIRDGLVAPALDVHKELSHLIELANRFADRKPDLADICLIRLSELHPRHAVVTVNVEDFRLYRKNRRETIPLIHPPGL